MKMLISGVTAKADYKNAIVSHQQGKFKTAYNLFIPLANQGHAEALFALGDMFYFGDGVDPDHKQASMWFRKAAEQGYAKAQYNLGTMHLKGESVTQDYNEAAKWFRKAAEQGFGDAQFALDTICK